MPDQRLQYVGTDDTWDIVSWVTTSARDWGTDFHYSIVRPPRMQFMGDRNSAVYTFRINLYDESFSGPNALQYLRRAIANILGYSRFSVVAQRFARVLPLKDPDGMGMVADRLLSVTFEGTSGYHPQTNTFLEGTFAKIPSTRDFSFVPTGDYKSTSLYVYALVEIEFCQNLYPVRTDDEIDALPNNFGERGRYMFCQENPSLEYVQLPRAQLFWQEGPGTTDGFKKVADGGQLIRMVSDIAVNWHRIPFDAMNDLLAAWQTALGTVNQSALELPMYNDTVSYDAETLLFMPWRTKPRLSPRGFLEYDVELHFARRDTGWNKFLYPNGQYYRVSWDNDGTLNNVYQTGDHDSIFTGF